MSFQDLESGGSGRSHVITVRQQQPKQDHSRAIGLAIFQINTALSAYHRLVASLGTPKDTPDLRRKLRGSRLKIEQLVKETSPKLKQSVEADWSADATKKISDFKLTRDFQYVLNEFQKAQRLAAHKESAYSASTSHQDLPSSNHTSEVDTDLTRSNEHMHLLAETRRPDVMLVGNEIDFNEALIEEREKGIIEIQQQVREVNEIFKDLALLVKEQGPMLDGVRSNLEISQDAIDKGTSQLTKASKIQRSNSSMKCLVLLILGIILLIVMVVVVA
ncbi:OLC1v1021037C1 [Oldenlandia corymbosa var. corymbosa]|uniref:OLC1v1021037C1 n=1 Tax=Oldenlandia corymbosa var. corymbosa TaxID=529605 RepID=A0AAV1BVD3_OLDCO|nr:OLC1v1021037C1 [Oldenlandia corymbosa var. corymbosa]